MIGEINGFESPNYIWITFTNLEFLLLYQVERLEGIVCIQWHGGDQMHKKLTKAPKNKGLARFIYFMDHPKVEPTNNQGEQSLRNLVIFRLSFLLYGP